MTTVLVLGAYGLAGRAIVDRLLRATSLDVIATGRRQERLEAEFADRASGRLQLRRLDAESVDALTAACRDADVVINAVGPYNLSGAAIARTVVACRRNYVDCANEQIHYERLLAIDEEARERGLLVATAAGLIPGLSTLLAASLLASSPAATRVDIRYAQLRHAYADGGHASVMGGVLDAVYRPSAIRGGRRVEVALGSSTKRAELPKPFGSREFLEVPNIDVPVLARVRSLEEAHTWVHLGDQPAWLFQLIRWLDPARRRWAYRLISAVVEKLTRHEFDEAVARGAGADAYVQVEVSGAGTATTAGVHFTDGATPTAILPVRLVTDLDAGRLTRRGLVTPVDLYSWRDVADELTDCVVAVDGDLEKSGSGSTNAEAP